MCETSVSLSVRSFATLSMSFAERIPCAVPLGVVFVFLQMVQASLADLSLTS